jgi:histone deacetylase 11
MPPPRIVYSPRYDIGFFGLERLHPFDSHKYRRAWRMLRHQLNPGQLRELHATPRRAMPMDELLAVHTREYLEENLRAPAYLAKALEIPQLARVPWRLTDYLVLRPMRWGCAGTLLAAQLALKSGGGAVNLSGGYHHASADRGEGFSIYCDIGLAITLLRRSRELADDDRIVYVDLDVHQGNGVARVFADDPRVFLFDMYNSAIYPRDVTAQRRVDCRLPISVGCLERDYLRTLTTELPRFLDGIGKTRQPRLAIYNAGTDVYVDDTLGHLNVSEEGVLKRDQFVITELTKRGIPWVMLPSGGYSADSFRLIANTVLWMCCSEL